MSNRALVLPAWRVVLSLPTDSLKAIARSKQAIDRCNEQLQVVALGKVDRCLFRERSTLAETQRTLDSGCQTSAVSILVWASRRQKLKRFGSIAGFFNCCWAVPFQRTNGVFVDG